jgi:hypothetical protein
MNFTYTKIEIDPSPTNPSGIVYRPEILLRVIGPTADVLLMALIDTGADECVLPFSIAQSIGVVLTLNETVLASGVGGQELELIPGDVNFELRGSGETYSWPIRVGFARFDDPEDECAILGNIGALEYFTATFDANARYGSLVANSRFPGRIG